MAGPFPVFESLRRNLAKRRHRSQGLFSRPGPETGRGGPPRGRGRAGAPPPGPKTGQTGRIQWKTNGYRWRWVTFHGLFGEINIFRSLSFPGAFPRSGAAAGRFRPSGRGLSAPGGPPARGVPGPAPRKSRGPPAGIAAARPFAAIFFPRAAGERVIIIPPPSPAPAPPPRRGETENPDNPLPALAYRRTRPGAFKKDASGTINALTVGSHHDDILPAARSRRRARAGRNFFACPGSMRK
jgi:hypothetical protein